MINKIIKNVILLINISSFVHNVLLNYVLIPYLVLLPTYTTKPNNHDVYLIIEPFNIKLSIVKYSIFGSFFNFKCPLNLFVYPFGISYSNLPVNILRYSLNNDF